MTIEVIEVPDGAATEMVRRVPIRGSGEFKLGAQVIVRESQTAVFFRDGISLDTFGPGRHTLSTLNLPLIGARVTGRVFGQSPFKAEVYFVNHKVFLGIKWGTRDPIAYRDRDLSVVRLRAHGEMAVRVTDPVLFVNKVVGVRGVYTAKDIDGFLKSIVLSSLAQAIGGTLQSIFDLPNRYDQLSTVTKARVFDEFASYGAELVAFIIEAITPSEEVQARIDERSGMGAVGDLDSYLRYKSALALGEAATSSGGAGSAMNAAAGLGLGLSVMRSAQEGTTIPSHLEAVIPPALVCSTCSLTAPAGSHFCPNCGRSLVATVCTNCQQPLLADARFCANCGTASDQAGNMDVPDTP
jgi:membrane protease subunit (stomatin/prohibitin family)